MTNEKNSFWNHPRVVLELFYIESTQENMQIFIQKWSNCLIFISENFDKLAVINGINRFYSTSLKFRDVMQDISKRKENGLVIDSLFNRMRNDIRFILQNNNFLSNNK